MSHLLLPVLPLRDVCLFPEASLTVAITRPAVVRALELARRCGNRLVAVAQKDPLNQNPSAVGLHGFGTIAEVVSHEVQSDIDRKIELDGHRRARIHDMLGLDVLVAEVEEVEEGDPGDEWGSAVEALARYMHAHADLRQFLDAQRRSKEPMAWVNLACQHLPITATARQKLLESDAAERCQKISRGLDALLKKEREG